MRQTVPEQKLVFCDGCRKELTKQQPDLIMKLDCADRDLHGDIVYGHTENFDFCYTCAIKIHQLIDSVVKPKKGKNNEDR